MSKLALFRTKPFQAILVTVISFGLGAAFGLDSDQDGMSDLYETFFGLNATDSSDAAVNYDSDQLVNSVEAYLWTDPRCGDTDLDGWPDDVDFNALSRAVIMWGHPDFSDGNTYSYTGPGWWVGAEKFGDGVWLNGLCWSVADSNLWNELRITVDRSRLTNNLIMGILYDDSVGSEAYVGLFDDNNSVIVKDLWGDLTKDSDQQVFGLYRVPLAAYPNASVIKLFVPEYMGPFSIYSTVLYIDEDADGLDADQEKQLGLSDLNNDCDFDGISDGQEVEAGTNPLDKVVMSKTHDESGSRSDRIGLNIPDSYQASSDLTSDSLTSGIDMPSPITSSLLQDTDGDGLSDWVESESNTNGWSGTDALDADTDDDGISDGYEYNYGLNPTNSFDAYLDPDGDLVPNLYEYVNGRHDPTNALSVPVSDAVISTNGHNSTYTNFQSAIAAATVASTSGYPIVEIETGLYDGSYCRNVNLTNDHLLIYGESASVIIDCQQDGRAFDISSGKPVLSGLSIQNGKVGSYDEGGALNIDGADAVIFNCIFSGNEASEGGAVYIDDADPVIFNCIFRENDATDGGAVYLRYGKPILINCVLIDNEAWRGAGFRAYGWSTYSSPTFINCSIVNNTASNCGGGFDFNTVYQPVLKNCLVWGNFADTGPQINKWSTWPTVSNSCIEDTLWSGAGNTTNEPHLVSADWHINRTNSSCFNGGAQVDFPIDDLDGERRETGIDIGADQFIDSDNDGLPDWWEQATGITNATQDADDVPDGLSNLQEFWQGTDPTLGDTDGDGASDFDESELFNTNNWSLSDPLDPDTDGDLMLDGYEYKYSLDTTDSFDAYLDPDGDMIPSLYEFMNGQSNPTNSSSAPGADSIVSLDSQNGTNSISAAVSIASNTSTTGYPIVFIDAGTYTVSREAGVLLTNDHILVYATNHSAIIDGQHGITRAFDIAGGHPVLSGLQMVHGYGSSGGSLYIDSASPVIRNCIIKSNEASSGGGIYLRYGQPMFINCVISGNVAGYGGGFAAYGYSNWSQPDFVNCTFNNNIARSSGGAMYLHTARSASVVNTLIWDNKSENEQQVSLFSSTLYATNNCVENELLPGVGNTTNDPCLVSGDWHLATTNSSCINEGSPGPVSDIDLDCESRDGSVDIGADEFIDQDGDGLPNWWEELTGATNALADIDDIPDGLSNLEEYTQGTDPLKGDTDNDGISDFVESSLYNTNWSGSCPLTPDTDNDGMLDGYEHNFGLHVTNSSDAYYDPDGDMVPNLYEFMNGETDPTNSSSIPVADAVVSINGAGGSFTNIASAINEAALSNDYPIVLISDGTYHANDYDGVLLTNDHLLVYGTNHTAIIDGQNGISRSFEILGGCPVLSGLVMQNGYSSNGGALYIDYADPVIRNCIFRDNRASSGGGIYLRYGKPVFYNCAVIRNVANYGGGFAASGYADWTNPRFVNCTFAGNYAKYRGGGIDLHTVYPAILENCLIWGNESASDPQVYKFSSNLYVSNSCVQGVLYTGPGNMNNTTNDPCLVSGDWHLATTNSSCINKGSPEPVSDIDLDCESRDGSVDIGADEFIDQDGDGLSDYRELGHEPPLDPMEPDSDNDGLSDGDEVLVSGTDPWDADCDDDGLDDGDEITIHNTNPWSSDTDDDGLSDCAETTNSPPLNPLSKDTDDDGLTDYQEINVYSSNPTVHDSMLDSDGDDILNVQENAMGTNPQSSSDPAQGTCSITVIYPSDGQTLD